MYMAVDQQLACDKHFDRVPDLQHKFAYAHIHKPDRISGRKLSGGNLRFLGERDRLLGGGRGR